MWVLPCSILLCLLFSAFHPNWVLPLALWFAADITRRELSHIFRPHEGFRVSSLARCCMGMGFRSKVHAASFMFCADQCSAAR